jgi:hypothetical protein
LNEHNFLVVGILGQAGPVTVHLDEEPFVGMVLESGRGWNGVAPGMRLRVTYIRIQPDSAEWPRSIPLSMIYVVEV